MNGFDEREELTRELRTRSQDVGGHPIGMEQVRRRAHRIVWRRRLVTGAVAAVVLAIAVPAGMAATGGVDRGVAPVGRPSPSLTPPAPSYTPTPSPSQSPPPGGPTGKPLPAGVTPLTAVGVTQGAGPSIPYLSGRTLHNDGTTDQMPGLYTTITPYHGGWLAYDPDHSQLVELRQDASGRVSQVPPAKRSVPSLAVNDSGLVAWFQSGGPGQSGQLFRAIATGMGEGQSSFSVPPGVSADPVGFVGGGTLVFETDGAHPQVLLTDFTPGSAQAWLKGAVAAGGASEAADAISVETKVTDFGSCWAVVDPGWTAMDPTGHERWHTCQYSLGKFSPDGTYVAAHEAYSDGLGASSIAILDAADGTPVARFQRPPDSDLYVADVAWEDNTHLLAVVHENGSWRILRLDTHGHVEAASAPARDVPSSNGPLRPFFFAATP